MGLEIGLVLTAMLVVGFLCQWLAWRLRLPAILFLLVAGIVLGPVTGLLQPDRLMGDLLFPVVSLAVAIILFEGSLTLRFGELAGIGNAVRGLVSYGAVLALLLLAAAAHWIGGLSWELSLLFGALTCVTGPTVIAPMLRTVRPNARIANVLRWEGIVIDPVGALFAVLVYEAIVSRREGHSIQVFLGTIACGAIIGTIAAFVLGRLLRRQSIPEYLQNYGTLAAVLAAFGASNALAHESGLLAVTIMGIALGNMRGVHVDDIMDFKEHLTTLLVSTLFIMLAARLGWPLPPGALVSGIAIFVVAQLAIRPLSVLVSSVGSGLNWRERALIAWVAPRGIVAASVSALFALRLEKIGMAGADRLVPLVFLLIIGTVVFQSATARPLAQWLRVAEPEPRGVLIFGSDAVALEIARALAQVEDLRVVVADYDWNGIRLARMEGLNTFFGNPASQAADRKLDLTGVGNLLAMSTHRELNSLVSVHYREAFGRDKVYRLRNLSPAESHDRASLAGSLLATALFDEDMTHTRFAEMLRDGWRIKSTRLTETFDWPHFIEQYGSRTVMLFGVEEKGTLRIASGKHELEPRPGWTVIALVPPL
ncbi:sodium/proton antiporter (CPA1 family) [Luteibacter rhizovicinus]|uniref:Sodium/proton antiporter (CPA1 family) n=1 Tax=Luteibacter rhizovicinus TaxID=242606 RepID=A0A4R3YWQ6_9GAMM|nr:sodium:proton antiporter [Luteibacter rhizovicinus]TCV96258.1 sodium/proton antiporter (CPA1 family) [Luteibacter rhizovicinus]